MASSSSSNSPCAACKFLRRKCMPTCIFAPYFPSDEPLKFANVHKIFGASNVSKLLNELLPPQREDAVNTLAYEADARINDPVYGCVGTISFLQSEVDRLEKELEAANATLFRYACNDIPISGPALQLPPGSGILPPGISLQWSIGHPRRTSIDQGGRYQSSGTSGLLLAYPFPWGIHNGFGGGGRSI